MNNEIKFEERKRIEIVLPIAVSEELIEKLDALKVFGYTVLPNVLGRGERGLRSHVGLGSFQYNFLLISCKEEEVDKILRAARPYLKSFGGVCNISDSKTLVHW